VEWLQWLFREAAPVDTSATDQGANTTTNNCWKRSEIECCGDAKCERKADGHAKED
jgi:hypothetical protein